MQHDFILLDRSGSMDTRWNEAINSVNAYVGQLTKENVDTGVTIAVFDTGPDGKLDFKVIRDRIIPKTMHPVTPTEVKPRNGTPLNDAILQVVTLAEAGNYEKVAIITMTDGYENASKEDPRGERAKAALKRCTDRGWSTIFLGADFNNTEQSRSLGVGSTNSAFTSSASLASAMSSLGTKRSAYAAFGATADSMSYTDVEKADLASK